MKAGKIIGIILLIVFLLGAFAAWQLFGPVIKNPQKKYLYIPSNATYEQVKDSLLQNEFIQSPFWFDQLAKYADYPSSIKPGKYSMEKGSSIYSVVKMLRRGTQVPVNLVITKIRTPEDLAARIGRQFETDSAEVMRFLENNDSLARFEVDTHTVLTLVIPNTYTYYWTSSVPFILQKLYREEEKFWNEKRLGQAMNLHLTPKQVYILASIVEEETNKNADKGKIASVYLNRLQKGMPLAADPTVKYAMRDFGLKRIYHKHLEYSSPYNTYRNKGLPPGPICTPSIKTMDAVLDAPRTDYLFFVAKADFSGYSEFATNYNQHLIYARAYQKALDRLEQERREKSGD